MAQTPQAPSAFRQDLLRGIRWGAILLISMLLSITAYRVLSSSPATASQPKPTEELTPAPVAVEPAPGPIQVGDAVLKNAEVPAEPQKPTKAKARQVPLKATAPTLEPPPRLSSPRFEPVPVAPMKPIGNAFVAAPLPDPAPAPVVDTAVPATAPTAPPPASDNGKQSNRAVRAVRSVGRLFRLGRKDEAKDSKQ
jgi:hypothetical protein